MHSGTSAERGHYYTYARSSKEAAKLYPAQPSSTLDSPSAPSPTTPTSSTSTKKQDEGWMMFNDSQVRPSSFESFTSITKTFPTDVAYLSPYFLLVSFAFPSSFFFFSPSPNMFT